MDLRECLSKQILVGDGATGTLLYSFGIDSCFEELNLSNSSQIEHIHREYIDAGADMIQTNTFGANYHKLKRYGLEKNVERINREGMRIARKASNGEVYIAGTIGGLRSFRKTELTLLEIKSIFEEQLDALLTEQPDALILETYYDLEELLSVLEIARKMTAIPIIANLSLHETAHLQNGMHINKAFRLMESTGADVIGLNCRMGPYHMIASFEEAELPEKSYLAAYPNASLPDLSDGRFSYSSDADYFIKSAEAFVGQGVRLIGGCCGTTPAHIKAIKKGIEGLRPLTKKYTNSQIKPQQSGFEVRPQSVPQNIKNSRQYDRTILVELDPPKTLGIDNFMEGSRHLLECGADTITLADNSLASPRISNMAVASLLKNRFNSVPLVHLTCRDHNLIGLQAHLMGLQTLGLTEVLAVTGDPSKIGDFPGATSVYDVSSLDLISLIKQFNRGLSYSGKSLGGNTDFRVAAAFNPNVKYLDKAVARLEKKIKVGADYFLTQPVFSVSQMEEIYQATKHIDKPIYLGIMPLVSGRNAEFLHNEVPGITLPDHVRLAMGRAGTSVIDAEKESIAIAKELIAAANDLFGRLYIITPFMKYELSGKLVQYANTIKKVINREVRYR